MGGRESPRLAQRTSAGRSSRAAARLRRPEVVKGLAVVAAVIVGVMFVLLRDTLLPARFSYDAASIQAIGQGARHVVDPAYESVAAVYKAVGLIDAPTAASLLGFVAAALVLAVSARRLLAPGAPVAAVALLFVAVLLSAVYLGTYSKDVFVLPIALLAVLPGERWRWMVLTGLAVLAYAAVFRTYWFLVLGIWLALQLVLARRPRTGWMLVAMAVGALALAAAISVVYGEPADMFRSSSNEYRIGSDDAQSAILPFVPGGTVLAGLINTPLTLLSLLLPLPLALKGGAYFLLLAVLLAVFWGRTSLAVTRAMQQQAGPATRSRIALLLAFVVVQAVFEPDYGSALRHLTPLLPIAVLLWSTPRASGMPRRAATRRQSTA